jgi:hypothetical protein
MKATILQKSRSGLNELPSGKLSRYFQLHWLILAMTSMKLFIQLVFPSHAYDLQRDEYLYLAEGNHLSWGYLEVPPTMAVLAVICKVLGSSMFVIRLLPALIGAATLYLTGKITLELGGGRFAQFIATVSFLFSAYLRVDMLFQPNALEILYFTWAAFLLIRYIHRPSHWYLIYIGIIMGFGLMNKYSMGLFIAGALVGLLLTPHRRLLKNKFTYLSAGIALVIFLPNLLWQWAHHWPVLHHMETLARTQLIHVSPASFISDQLVMCLPGIAVWVAGLWFLLFPARGKPYRWLGWIYLTVIGILLILHGKGYYALGTYPMLLAAGGLYLASLTRDGWRKIVWRPVLLLYILGTGLLIIPLTVPVFAPWRMAEYCEKFRFTGVTRWEDNSIHALPQDYADMRGWKQIGLNAARTYASLDLLTRSHTIIYGDNYGLSGAVSYYGRCMDLPVVQGKEASFLLWTPLNQHVDNLLLLSDDSTDGSNPILTRNFSRIRYIGKIDDPYSREQGDIILMCYGANAYFNAWFNERNRAMESLYR